MERLLDAADVLRLPDTLEPIPMPGGMWLAVHTPNASIVWTDALRDLQRLRAAADAWRRECERLREEIDELRWQIVDILEPRPDDYAIDEATEERP